MGGEGLPATGFRGIAPGAGSPPRVGFDASVVSVMSENESQKKGGRGLVAAEAEEAEEFVAEFHGAAEAAGGEAADFFEPVVAGVEKLFEVGEALASIGVFVTGGVGLGDAFAEGGQGGIDFAFFAFDGDGAEHFEDVFDGFEVVAAVAHDVGDFDDLPVLQFAETGADVGAGDAEEVADVLGVEGFFGEEEEGVDLRHGAIDAPAGPHFAPMEDEFLGDGGEGAHFLLFCLDRNRGNGGIMQGGFGNGI